MENKFPKCPICGGLDYFTEGGYYYCSECQTQSQDIREVVHNYQDLIKGVSAGRTLISRSKKKSRKQDEGEEWTMWELLNFVLKGMVDELLALGAAEKLKVVVLQLWATYLQNLEVAFTSKEEKFKLPKLGFNYHERDGRLIYGIQKKKKREGTDDGAKKKKKKRIKEIKTEDVSPADLSETRYIKYDYHKTKRALFHTEYEKDCEQREVNPLSLLNDSYTMPQEESKVEDKELDRSFLSKIACETFDSKKKSSSVLMGRTTEKITRVTLLAIIHIALMICQDKIQLSDLIRWIEEGDISYYDVTHFLPDTQKLKGTDNLVFMTFTKGISYRKILSVEKELASFLNITHIAPPDMTALVARFVEELQLPAEIVCLVERLRRLTLKVGKVSRARKCEFIQNHEGEAMGFIMVTLKLLLGLNGHTEYMASQVAHSLNKLLDNSPESRSLFVWTDWVKYIECRKAVLSHVHFPTQDLLSKEMVVDPILLSKLWKKTKLWDAKKEDRVILKECSRIAPAVRNGLSTVLQELEMADGRNSEMAQSVSSFTPLTTCLKTLHTAPEGSVLAQAFTRSSLSYLLEPDHYADLVKRNGMNMIVKKNCSPVQMEIVENFKEKSYYTKTVSYAITRNSEDVEKQVKTKPHKKTKCSANKKTENCDPFKNLDKVTRDILLTQLKENNVKVEDILGSKQSNKQSDLPGNVKKKDSSPERPSTSSNESERLTLNIPYSQYWMFNVNARKMSYEEFENTVMKNLAFSFQWLLRECARTVRMGLRDLYAEMVDIELTYLNNK